MMKRISSVCFLFLIIMVGSTLAEDVDDFCYIGPQDCSVTCGYDSETGEERRFGFIVGNYIAEKNSGDVTDFRIGYYYKNIFQGWLIGEARKDWADDADNWYPHGDRYVYNHHPDDGVTVHAIRRMYPFASPDDQHFLARVDITFPSLITYSSNLMYGTNNNLLNVWRTYGLDNVCSTVNVALFSEAWNYDSATSNDAGRIGLFNSVRCKCDISGAVGGEIATPQKQRYWDKDNYPGCETPHENSPQGRSNCNNGKHSNINDYCLLEDTFPEGWHDLTATNGALEPVLGETTDDTGCGRASDTGYQNSLGV